MNQALAKKLVAEARKIARKADSWMTLTNALSNPLNGLIIRYFPDLEQRKEFLKSPEYKVLDELLLRLIKRKGLYPRAARGKNGAGS
jgi:hypothetical protein